MIRKQTALPRSKDLARYRTEGDDFLRHIVTCNETWVHHDISESKQTSMEWLKLGETTQQKPKTRLCVGKVLATFSGIAEAYCPLIFSTNQVQLMPRTTAECLMK